MTATMSMATARNRPHPGDVVVRLATGDRDAKRIDAALVRYETLLKTEPDYWPVLYRAGRLLGTGSPPRDPVRGEALVRRACDITLGQHLWSLYALTEVLMAAGRWDEAYATAQRVRRLHPGHQSLVHLEARCVLGMAKARITR